MCPLQIRYLSSKILAGSGLGFVIRLHTEDSIMAGNSMALRPTSPHCTMIGRAHTLVFASLETDRGERVTRVPSARAAYVLCLIPRAHSIYCQVVRHSRDFPDVADRFAGVKIPCCRVSGLQQMGLTDARAPALTMRSLRAKTRRVQYPLPSTSDDPMVLKGPSFVAACPAVQCFPV